MRLRKCEYCGREIYLFSHGNQKYCSVQCRTKAANLKMQDDNAPQLEVRKCAYCGDEFKQRIHKQIFCSSNCRKLGLKHKIISTTPKADQSAKRECKGCGKMFHPGRGGATCCSHACHNKVEFMAIGEKNWKKGDKPLKLHIYCEECGERFTMNGHKNTVQPKELLCFTCREQIQTGVLKRGAREDSITPVVSKPRKSMLDIHAKMARDLGMSYGKFMAMRELQGNSGIGRK